MTRRRKSTGQEHRDVAADVPRPAARACAAAPARWAILSTMSVFVLVSVAAFLPRAQLWGVNHLAFYPAAVRAAVLAFLAATFLPPIHRRAYGGMLALSRALERGGPRVDLVLTVIAVGSVVLFTVFHTSTNLLGDGQLIAQSYEAAWAGNDRVIMRSVRAIVTEERIAPGATLMYYGAAKAVTAAVGRGPVWGIRLFVSILGAVFVYLVFVLARGRELSPPIRAWFLVLALFSTTNQLFFGYIENYAPLVFTGLLYVLAGLFAIHGRRRLWVAVALFLVSFYTHIQAVLFGPSLVYLILWLTMRRRRRAVERHAVGVIAVAVVVAAAAAAVTRFGRFYLPLRGDEQSYELFSPVHLLDVLNEILMLMPIAPLLVVLAWLGRTAARRPPGPGEKPAPGRSTTRGWFTMTAEWHFAILVLLPCSVYLLLFKPEIGMARDWDLFTMTSLGLVPLALLVVGRFLRTTGMGTEAGAFTVPALAIYAVLAVSWVGVNASPARSTARFERILEYDKTHASYAYENLSIFYHDRGMMDKAVGTMETACDISHNPRQYVRLAMYYSQMGRGEEALELMRETVRKHPKYHKSRFYLVSLLEKEKKFDELLAVARDGTKYSPTEAIYWFYYGEISIARGNVEEGLAALKRCLTLDPPERARKRCLEQLRAHSRPQP